MVATSVQSKDAHILRLGMMNLLEKRALEKVPPAQSESGFYSHYLSLKRMAASGPSSISDTWIML